VDYIVSTRSHVVLIGGRDLTNLHWVGRGALPPVGPFVGDTLTGAAGDQVIAATSVGVSMWALLKSGRIIVVEPFQPGAQLQPPSIIEL
jgi:hypothetical protein